jgi:deoxyribonuclease-4
MRRLGVHTSIAGGLHLALRRGHELGCTTVQIFSHNPRGWRTRAITQQEVSLFTGLRRELDISPVYVHASYLINIASPSGELWRKSASMLEEEMRRADQIGADFIVLHTGSAHDAEGAHRAAKGIREALGRKKFKAGLLIENTSGKRGDIASGIIEIAGIMEEADGHVCGVCIDSCHAFAAGYDLRKMRGMNRLAHEAEEYIGRHRIKLIHLNDSRGHAGSGTDRHEHIGLGKIGMDALRRFVNHPTFANIPVVLETPKKSDADDVENLKKVREMLRK